MAAATDVNVRSIKKNKKTSLGWDVIVINFVWVSYNDIVIL